MLGMTRAATGTVLSVKGGQVTAPVTGFVDIHVHLIPGVDDGPGTFEQFLQMLRVAYESGTRKLIATPHMFLDPYNNSDLLKMFNRFADLVAELRRVTEEPEFSFLSEMAVYLGSENYVSFEFLEALRDRSVLTLNGSRYLLLEYPAFLAQGTLEYALEQVVAAGFVPVIAHPERYRGIRNSPEAASRLLELGCVLQVNASSVLAESGSSLKRTALWLLDRDLAQIVATDGHGVNGRAPSFGAAFAKLSALYSPDKAQRLMIENPLAIIRNRSLLSVGKDN